MKHIMASKFMQTFIFAHHLTNSAYFDQIMVRYTFSAHEKFRSLFSINFHTRAPF